MRKIIYTCIKEKFGIEYIICLAISAIIFFYLPANYSYIIAIEIVFLTAILSGSFWSNTGVNTVNASFTQFKEIRGKYALLIGLFLNAFWLFLLAIKNYTNFSVFSLIVLIWLSTTSLGVYIGCISKNTFTVVIIFALFSIMILQNNITQELYFRYITPMLICSNIYISSNIFSEIVLSFVCIFGLIYSKKFKTFIVIGFIFYLAIFVNEISEDMKCSGYVNVETEYNEHIETINDINVILKNMGYPIEINSYYKQESIFFPWENKTNKQLFIVRNDICYINYYANYLRKMSSSECANRYISYLIKSDGTLQEIGKELLIAQISSELFENKNSNYVESFLPQSQISKYGNIVSPKQCLWSEILLQNPSDFFEMYNALSGYNSIDEIDLTIIHQENLLSILKEVTN